MRFTRVAPVALIVSGMLAGCTTAPTPTPTPTIVAVSADATCEQVSDVGTLVANLRVAHQEGRISDQEWVGAQQLAARMLLRVDAEPGTDIEGALGGLQLLVTSPTNELASVDVASEEWYAAFHAFDSACQAVGYPFGVYGWVGG